MPFVPAIPLGAKTPVKVHTNVILSLKKNNKIIFETTSILVSLDKSKGDRQEKNQRTTMYVQTIKCKYKMLKPFSNHFYKNH